MDIAELKEKKVKETPVYCQFAADRGSQQHAKTGADLRHPTGTPTPYA